MSEETQAQTYKQPFTERQLGCTSPVMHVHNSMLSAHFYVGCINLSLDTLMERPWLVMTYIKVEVVKLFGKCFS